MDRVFRQTQVLRTDETAHVAPSVADAYEFVVAGPQPRAAEIQAAAAPESVSKPQDTEEVVQAEDDVEEAENASDEPTAVDLSELTRAELNALAEAAGIEGAEDLPNKKAVIDALLGA